LNPLPSKTLLQLGGNFEVFHYTQIIARLIETQEPNIGEYQAKVTYHDPCYLGRHNGEYAAPRKILQSIPGIQFVEMLQHSENSFCCGGGGGNFFTDILGGGDEAPNRIRVRQAIETGADTVAVACPQCAKMLDDAINAEELDGKLQVLDVAEIVMSALT